MNNEYNTNERHASSATIGNYLKGISYFSMLIIVGTDILLLLKSSVITFTVAMFILISIPVLLIGIPLLIGFGQLIINSATIANLLSKSQTQSTLPNRTTGENNSEGDEYSI